MLDVNAPAVAKKLPVVFWIRGGAWQSGDESAVNTRPRAVAGRGFVFVSTTYRLLPDVVMGTIVRDVAKAVGGVRDHISEHGGDPKRTSGCPFLRTTPPTCLGAGRKTPLRILLAEGGAKQVRHSGETRNVRFTYPVTGP